MPRSIREIPDKEYKRRLAPDVGGRPTKLNPGLEAKICDVLATGQSRAAAAASVGISRETFYNWVKKAKNDDGSLKNGGKYRRFLDNVEAAEDEAESLVVNKLRQNVMEGSQRAIEFWLTSRRSETWNPRTTQDVSHSGDVVVTIPDSLKPPKKEKHAAED